MADFPLYLTMPSGKFQLAKKYSKKAAPGKIERCQILCKQQFTRRVQQSSQDMRLDLLDHLRF